VNGHVDRALVERVFREAHGQAVATLVRVFGDITLAEDAVQDAFAVAVERWTGEAIPPNPAGWIVTTARNRAIDVVRRAARGRELIEQLGPAAPAAFEEEFTEESPVADDQLRLIFTCCHPALRIEHQIALTLRLLGGLGVDEIARSFLVTEAAMAKRLVRAKYKIKAANIPYRIPSGADLPHRLDAVLSVIYLIYTTGSDDPERSLLRADAIRLARALAGLMPDEPEAIGLLALLLLNESRVTARWVDGSPVLLADQDRSVWDRHLIGEGHELVRRCIRRDRPGPYQLQAAIQAVHCSADSFEQTDWSQIVAIYEQLSRFLPTPVVALNRAIALGERDGAETALGELDDLAAELDAYHPLHAARGTMLARLGRIDEAIEAFERASEVAPTEVARNSMARELEMLEEAGASRSQQPTANGQKPVS
jgi:RNA polymerase sigma-70 factor (ECF subfamily)